LLLEVTVVVVAWERFCVKFKHHPPLMLPAPPPGTKSST
jgi:hypothetical protein